MSDNLKTALEAITEAERQRMLGDSGSLAPSMHFNRAQAYALVGILELLIERLPGPTSVEVL